MNLEAYRQVISNAIQAETEAREFYENVARRIKDPSLKETFEHLAKEEAGHENLLTAILKKEKMDTSFFDFEKDFKVSETIEMPEVTKEMDLKDAIGIAMKNEEIAMNMYTSLADNCEDPEMKAVFQDLAAMERHHKFKMESTFMDVAYPEVW